MLTALELKRAGLDVEIIDRAWRTSAESYACGLHAPTVEILRRHGLGAAALDAGLPLTGVAFYEGPERRAEVTFDGTAAVPTVLVLPQDRLEELLEEKLRELGVRVRWGHRLDDLQQEERGVKAVVERLALTSVGYPYARSEQAVDKVIPVEAKFVVGADGAASHVRHILGIGTRQAGPAATFEVFEFEPREESPREVQIALGPQTTDVFWPQPGFVCRWSLQMLGEVNDPRPPGANAGEMEEGEVDRLSRLLKARAPWFTAGVKEIVWSSAVQFESMRAEVFGKGRCWLVGDAGHQTSPVGMQSMNVGLREAVDAAAGISRALSGDPSAALTSYDSGRRAEWDLLLGQRGRLAADNRTAAWVTAHRTRLLPLLPGSAESLAGIAGRFGLELSTSSDRPRPES